MFNRVALLGCGFGRAIHAKCVQNHHLLTLKSVYSRRLEKAKSTAKEFGAPVFTDKIEQLIDSKDYDLYIVALPPSIQVEVVTTLLKKDRAVFSEKPLGGLPTDLKHLLEGKDSLKLMVNYEFLQIDLFRRVGNIISEGVLGELREVSVLWTVQTHPNRTETTSWKRMEEMGGGALNMFVSHVYHYLSSWMGKPNSLSTNFFREHKAAEHTVTSTIQWSNTRAHITVCTNATNHLGQRIEILGKSGRVVLRNATTDPISGFECEIYQDEAIDKLPSRWAFDPNKDGRLLATEAMLLDFVERLNHSQLEMSKLKKVLIVEQMLLAARRSANLGGQWVSL